MAAINFGNGPNTASGDTVTQALAKLQSRIDAFVSAPPVTPALPVVSIGAAQSAAEGDSGTTALTFTVTRTGTTTGVSSVGWAVTGTGANPASVADFGGGVLPSGTVSFAAGETSKQITVNVAGDAEVEPNENFLVTLSNPNGCTIGTATSTGTILNDDSSGGLGIPVAKSDFGAPEASRTSGATAYPVTVDPVFLPAEHMVGDTLRIFVSSAIAETGGLLLPSGSIIVNDTITLVADATTNRMNLNAKLAGIAAGVGFVFLRTERAAQASSWSIPHQYGTAAVPAITSALTFSVTEGQQLAYTATTASPVKAVYIVGQDGDRVEFTGAKPGSSFPMRFVGGATKTYPADDFDGNNVYDIGFEVLGLNGVRSTVTSLALTLLDLDLEADAFNFADVTGVALNAYGRSPTVITVSGLTPGESVPISGSAGVRFILNGGAPVTTGNVQNGTTIEAEVLTPGTASRTVATINYGGQTDSFNADNTGYVAPVLSTWAGATGDGIADGSITLSEGNRKATMTRAEGDRRAYSAATRNSGRLWVEIIAYKVSGTVAIPCLYDAANNLLVRYETNTSAGDAGGGWNLTYDNGAAPVAIRYEVDFETKTITAFRAGANAGTKAFPTSTTALTPAALLAYAVGPYVIINTGQAAPVGTVTTGFQPWG